MVYHFTDIVVGVTVALYDCKENVLSKMFFTSDLHFFHRKIVEYTNRGVDTTQEDHDEWLIQLWNNQVCEHDIIFHLGDFAFNKRKPEFITSVTSRLNGRIVFVRGNHDDRDAMNNSGHEWYDLKSKWFRLPSGEKQYIVMCHYALEIWEQQAKGSWNLFGHSHGSFQPKDGKRLDVGLDNAYNLFGEHRFFTIEDIERYMRNREVVFKDHHSKHTNQ